MANPSRPGSIARSASACSGRAAVRRAPAVHAQPGAALAHRPVHGRGGLRPAARRRLHGRHGRVGYICGAVIPDNFFRKGLPGESGASLGADARDKTGKAALAPARLAAGRPARLLPHEQPVTPADQASPPNRHSPRAAPTPRCFPWRPGAGAGRQRPTADAGPADTRRAAGLARAARTDRALPGAARGIVCDASQVVVLSGIRDGLDLCGRILLTPRDKVLIEDPGYVNAVPIYRPYTSGGCRCPSMARALPWRGGAACAA